MAWSTQGRSTVWYGGATTCSRWCGPRYRACRRVDSGCSSGATTDVADDRPEQLGCRGTAVLTESGGRIPRRAEDDWRRAPPEPAHIHAGSCAQPDPTRRPSPCNQSPTVSSTDVNATIAMLTEPPHAVHMHKSADELSVYLACADIVPISLPRTGEAQTPLTGTWMGLGRLAPSCWVVWSSGGAAAARPDRSRVQPRRSINSTAQRLRPGRGVRRCSAGRRRLCRQSGSPGRQAATVPCSQRAAPIAPGIAHAFAAGSNNRRWPTRGCDHGPADDTLPLANSVAVVVAGVGHLGNRRPLLAAGSAFGTRQVALRNHCRATQEQDLSVWQQRRGRPKRALVRLAAATSSVRWSNSPPCSRGKATRPARPSRRRVVCVLRAWAIGCPTRQLLLAGSYVAGSQERPRWATATNTCHRQEVAVCCARPVSPTRGAQELVAGS